MDIEKLQATDRLLLPEARRLQRYRFELATSGVYDLARLGYSRNDATTSRAFEPRTRDIPEDFTPAGNSPLGEGTQFKIDGVFTVERVLDLTTGQ